MSEPRIETPRCTREEQLEWCKARALVYADRGDMTNCIASMASDMGSHPETRDHVGLQLMMMSAISGHLDTAYELRKFIEGFN